VDFTRKNQVAILYSDDSHYGIEFMKFSDHQNYRSILMQMYGALYRANIGVDFVFPEGTNYSHYKVIIVPPLYVASDAALNKLVEFVRAGGHVVMAFKSGFCNEYSTVRWQMAPGPLREAAGFHYQEFSNLAEPVKLKGDPFHGGAENKVTDWAEFLILDTAKPLAYYDHSFFGKYPAITQNTFGKGILTYEGTALSDALQSDVLLSVLQLAGLTGPDQTMPAPVRVKHGVNRKGRTLHYYLILFGRRADRNLRLQLRRRFAHAIVGEPRPVYNAQAVGSRHYRRKIARRLTSQEKKIRLQVVQIYTEAGKSLTKGTQSL
jgi:beta-galactosidase